MKLLSTLIVAFFIAGVGVITAYFVDHGFQVKLSKQNAQIQRQLALDLSKLNARIQRQLAEEKFRATRTALKAQTIENVALRFMETAYGYTNALESAFKDTYFRHNKFHGDSNGPNQIRYENVLHPKLSALMSQLMAVCASASKSIDELKRVREEAFSNYNAIENLPSDAKWNERWNARKINVEEAVRLIQVQANNVYKDSAKCVEGLAITYSAEKAQ